MISHVTLGTNDLTKALAFYDDLFAILGMQRFFTADWGAAYGIRGQGHTLVMRPYDGQSATPGNGMHVAYLARDRTQVDLFYQTAMENGATDEGAPGLRPQYHADYYACYIRDPDGNKLQAVCHDPAN